MHVRKLSVVAIAAGAATVGAVLVATPSAVAANGRAILLGRSNYATATTTVTNTAGTPLSLRAKAGYAPLRVNSAKTVTNLSADRLDGLSSGSFLRSSAAAGFATTKGRTGFIFDANEADDFGPRCPSGTIAVSGGSLGPAIYAGPDFTVDGRLIANSWVGIDIDGNVLPTFVTCYNPRGAVPGAATSLPWVSGGAAAAGGRTSGSLKR